MGGWVFLVRVCAASTSNGDVEFWSADEGVDSLSPARLLRRRRKRRTASVPAVAQANRVMMMRLVTVFCGDAEEVELGEGAAEDEGAAENEGAAEDVEGVSIASVSVYVDSVADRLAADGVPVEKDVKDMLHIISWTRRGDLSQIMRTLMDYKVREEDQDISINTEISRDFTLSQTRHL